MKSPTIVLFRKLSKLEWDARRYKQRLDDMASIYKAQGIDPDTIIQSHLRQNETFKRIEDLVRKRFPHVPPTLDSGALIDGEKDCIEQIRHADLVVASVGDELATSVAREIRQGRLIAINADPLTSEGALLWPSVDEFEEHFDAFPDDLPTEFWPRIQVLINGVHFGDAIGDVFIGARERRQISRYSLSVNGTPPEQQESSGIIISSGAGSTGWYRSAFWSDFTPPNDESFSSELHYVVTEPYRGKLTSYETTEGILKPGEEIVVQSLMADGIISIDSHTILRFGREIEAKIKAADNSIIVQTPNYEGKALKETFIGNKLRQLISRFVVTFPGKPPEQQKSSGLIVATQEGAPDWFLPASYIRGSKHNSECVFSRHDNKFKFLVTEPASRRYSLTRGELLPSQSIQVISRMPEGGIVSLDSYQNGVFSSGYIADLRFSPLPLQVIMRPDA